MLAFPLVLSLIYSQSDLLYCTREGLAKIEQTRGLLMDYSKNIESELLEQICAYKKTKLASNLSISYLRKGRLAELCLSTEVSLSHIENLRKRKYRLSLSCNFIGRKLDILAFWLRPS